MVADYPATGSKRAGGTIPRLHRSGRIENGCDSKGKVRSGASGQGRCTGRLWDFSMRQGGGPVNGETSYEERAKAIFGERADQYTTSAAHTDREVLDRMVEMADPNADWRVLDIGTGTGHTALTFAPHVREVVGLDLTEEMLREARKLAQERGVDNVTFHAADVHRLPRDLEASFDLVTCRRAAHHFSDIDRALAEMVRTLRPAGMLLIDDRSVPEDDWIDETMHRLDRLHDASHVRQYRASRWLALLENAGLSVEVVEPYTKHRPVTALTDRVSPESVAEIHAILGGVSPEERSKLRLETVEGEDRSTHWYLMVAARRP
jgi:ubiquinone/menaquinone biosynthesis C-methylase UbiE